MSSARCIELDIAETTIYLKLQGGPTNVNDVSVLVKVSAESNPIVSKQRILTFPKRLRMYASSAVAGKLVTQRVELVYSWTSTMFSPKRFWSRVNADCASSFVSNSTTAATVSGVFSESIFTELIVPTCIILARRTSKIQCMSDLLLGRNFGSCSPGCRWQHF